MKERYLHSVRNLLDCPSKEKGRLLQRLDNAVATYLEDDPDAGEHDLVAVFGTPEECAARLLEEYTPGSVVAERRKRSHHYHVLIAGLAVLLVIVIGIAAYLWFNGGLAIIRTYPVSPDFMKEMPSDHIIYDYGD